MLLVSAMGAGNVQAQQILLYQNNFESPLMAPVSNCSPDLDATTINTLWGGTGQGVGGGGLFQQQATVETILINGPNNQYTDASGTGGNYCLSMLSAVQNDQLALSFNAQLLPFANITFDLSPINMPSCGGPFVLDTAVMQITVFDSPGGNFDINAPGQQLDQRSVREGLPDPDPFTFNWAAMAAES